MDIYSKEAEVSCEYLGFNFNKAQFSKREMASPPKGKSGKDMIRFIVLCEGRVYTNIRKILFNYDQTKTKELKRDHATPR